MHRFADKVAVITGASRGMGAATARLFVGEGAKVVLLDMLEDEGRALRRELGEAALFRRHDVSDEDDWRGMLDEVLGKWGRIDILVNNAAINVFKSIATTEKAELERLLAVNLMGPFLGIKFVGPVMAERGRGSIINISSTAGFEGKNGLGAYTSSKWGLRGLTKVAGLEFGHRGVRVNSIHPGGTNTQMGNVLNEPEADLAKYYRNQPIRRIGRPDEIAHATLFLASDEASYVCGAELTVDGGALLGPYLEFLPGRPED